MYNISKGNRVGLRFHPFCVGVVIAEQPALIVGNIKTRKKFKVKWDKKEHGESGWLSPDDLTPLDN